jgi:hypothetical protein
VEVVEHQHERPSLSSVAEKLGNSLEEAEARGLRVGVARRRRTRHRLSCLGDELREIGGAAPELRAERLRVKVADIRTKRLHPRPVGRRAPGLPATPPEDACRSGTRTFGELVGQAALADSGFAGNEEQPAAPPERVIQPGREGVELALAPDEDRALR